MKPVIVHKKAFSTIVLGWGQQYVDKKLDDLLSLEKKPKKQLK